VCPPDPLLRYWALYLITHLPTAEKGLNLAFTELVTQCCCSAERGAAAIMALLRAVTLLVRDGPLDLDAAATSSRSAVAEGANDAKGVRCAQPYLRQLNAAIRLKFGNLSIV
jgi:hypothetical protein